MSKDPVIKAVVALGFEQKVTTRTISRIKADLEALEASSKRQEELFDDLLEALTTIVETSVDTQKRLSALEEHTGLKPAS